MSQKNDESLDKATAAEELAINLHEGLKLIQTEGPSASNQEQHHDLKSVLKFRLSQYYSSRKEYWVRDDLKTLLDAQLLTAREALAVLGRIQKLLAIEDDAVVPAIGTRDLNQIRTMLSLVFKWGTDPLLNQIQEIWPLKPPPRTAVPHTTIVDVSSVSDQYSLLSELILHIINLLLPNDGKLPQSYITTTLLSRHLVDIVRPALALGWLPKSLSTQDMPVVDQIRPLVVRLLGMLPPSQTISSLGSIISSSPPPPLHVYRACTTLLSRQVLRRDGVKGLFTAVFGEEETGGDFSVEKLEHVSTVLNAVPAITKPLEYFEHIIPRIIALLSDQSPPAYRRAAAFTISRLLRDGDTSGLRPVKQLIISRLLHDPLRLPNGNLDGQDFQLLERVLPQAKIQLRPDVAIEALLALVSNADPSPPFISELLSPVIPSLYSLLYHLNRVKTSDPELKESIHGMLLTWAKIVSVREGLEVLWSIIKDAQEYGWNADLEGHIFLLPEAQRPPPPPLLTPEQMREVVDPGDLEFDSNVFSSYPDPKHFVTFLGDIGRGDISSSIFVRLLEAYREEKSSSSGNSLRILLYLQIIIQMQNYLSEGTTSNILKKPQQILSFIHHVLESANSTPLEPQFPEISKLEEKLKIVSLSPEVKGGVEYEGDSDDDTPGSDTTLPDDELIQTAINLLLAVLEADEHLSAGTLPVLNDIFSLLEPLSRIGSSYIRPLAREARLVMTARLASMAQSQDIKGKNEESAQEIYQKALKLLQDPILPVRAHGLLLLRHLVTPSNVGSKEQDFQKLDPALTPAILSIFLQSVQDEDSYIFLNAVQGLAAMVDSSGREVLKGLIQEYAGKLEGLGASVVSQQEVDVRTRVGEALGIVIKRCGGALGVYIDVLVPPLSSLVRAREIPTTLRTSAISLLADCVNTYSLAVLAYIEDLGGAMIDLLQIESVPGARQDVEQGGPSGEGKNKGRGMAEENKATRETMDDEPTSTNSKFPPLRRAALHFLGLLVKETTRHIYDGPSPGHTFLSQAMVRKATITLAYISSTDEDDVVRVMAREVREGLDDLKKAILGL